MSKLEELIKELCPNGVEYTTVGEVCNISRGIVLSKDYIRENVGEYPVYSSQTENNGCLGYVNFYKYDGEYITWTTDGANAGTVFYRTGKFNITNVCGLLEVLNTSILPKFLYYVLSVEAVKYVNAGMGNPKLMSNVMAGIKLPLPPLAVQREIVHILDKFTLLSAELTAELTARRKQYEFYRDKLLTFNTNIEFKKLSDVVNSISSGKNNDRNSEGLYNVFGSTGIIGKCDKYVYDENRILVARVGANAGYVHIATGKYDVSDNTLIVDLKKNINLKYIYYLLQNQNLNQYAKGGGQPLITAGQLKELTLPIPPLEVQERIVNVLDNFDAICSDLGIGLPAEIEKRQQQYEYYRDKLLTFDLGSATIYQTDRQTDRQTGLIRLFQYVFGFAPVRLGDIATITRGGNFQKKDFCECGVPCIHYGQIYTKFGIYANTTISNVSNAVAEKSKKAVTNDIIMAVTSENVEDVCKCVAWLGNEKIAVSGHTAVIHHNQNAKYLSYYFHTSMFFEQKKKLAHGTKVIEVTPDSLNNVVISLPPIEEQNRIVEILDRFDKLCNDISQGLPAEIEARQKQYEHYRDKMLKFRIKN